MSYEEALQLQIDYLTDYIKHPRGVEQGYLVFDAEGNALHRVGRQSLNPPWYREFYNRHHRKPTQKEIPLLAEQMLNEGYKDEYGIIPPFKNQDLKDF